MQIYTNMVGGVA